MRISLIWLSVALLISCSSDVGGVPEKHLDLATKHLKDRLIDPDSLQIRNIKANPPNAKMPGFCGEYNAKNRMGGYVGFKYFHAIYFDDLQEMIVTSDLDEGPVENIPIMCSGLFPSPNS